jgi:nitroreductase
MSTIPATPAASSATRFHERYRAAALKTPAAWNATLDTLVAHRSVRAYLPDPLPDGTLELLTAAAQSAPSSSNLQAWSVVVVEDPERKARLAALAGNQKHIVQAPVFLLWLVDLHRLAGLGKARSVPSEGLSYLELFLLGAVDAALAAQNAVVALESLGLGSVYIGGIRNKPAEVAAELGLPPHVFALFGLVVGRPDPAAPASVKPRLPQEAILFREKYGSPAAAEALAVYDQRLREFQREQGLPERDWTEQAAQRVRGPEALAGRDVLSSVLQGLGFGLK